MIRRALAAALALAMGALVCSPIAAAAGDSPLSPGCRHFEDPALDTQFSFAALSDQVFYEGEHITATAGPPVAYIGDTPPPLPTRIQLSIDSVVVAEVDYPGTLSYTFPDDTTLPWPSVLKTDDVSNFPTWQLGCTAPDTDGDGIIDRRDLCPGTVLPDVPTKGLQGARFAAQTDGTFDSGMSRFDGLYTLEDTHGCSGTQIIEREGLGGGHLKFGISKGALEDFITSLSGT